MHSFTHGFTFAGHPVCSAIAMANLDVFEREGILEQRALERGRVPRRCSTALRELPIVGDIRGTGYFHAIELVKDQQTKETFDDEECETLLRGFLSGELYRRGLICRADDRGDPVIQLSPPLIAGPEQFAEIEEILRGVLTEAGERMRVRSGAGHFPVRPGVLALDAHRPGPAPRPRRSPARGGARAASAGQMGSYLRAARSDAVAVGR